MSIPRLTDAGRHLQGLFSTYAAQVAGATAAITTLVFDRMAGSTKGMPSESVSLMILMQSVLADTKTISVAIDIAESADNSTYGAFAALKASTLVATGLTGGTTVKSVIQYNLKLSGYKRYVKFKITPTMTATSTDTAAIAAITVDNGSPQYLVTDDGWNLEEV